MKYISYLLFCLVIFHIKELRGTEIKGKQNVYEITKGIPTKDKEILHDFFKRLFLHGEFAQTTLGHKPMATVDFNLQYSFITSNKNHRRDAILIYNGWKVWEKYKHLFKIEKFCFSMEYTDSCIFGINIININKSLSIIQKHHSLFCEYLQEELSSEEILKYLCDGKLFKNKNTLYFDIIGLLYGYGKKNVKAFKNIISHNDNLAFLPYDKNHKKKLLSKCNEDKEFVKCSKKDLRFFPIRPYGFWSTKNNNRTQKIQKDFDNLKLQILDIFYSENFLEIILEKLL